MFLFINSFMVREQNVWLCVLNNTELVQWFSVWVCGERGLEGEAILSQGYISKIYFEGTFWLSQLGEGGASGT